MTLADRIASLRRTHGGDLMEALSREGDVPSLVLELADMLDMTAWSTLDGRSWAARFDLLSYTEVVRRRCALVQDPSGALQLLMADPFDTDQLAWVTTRHGALPTVLAGRTAWETWLALAEAGRSALDDVTIPQGTGSDRADATEADDLSLSAISAHDSPAVRFVNSTFYDGLKTGASDVHLESDPKGMAVKFRLDGVLTAVRRIDSLELAAQAISRIKVMAQLDIAERRVPQDGRLQISYQGRAIDVRVSIMPSIHGEDAVLRILDRQHLAQSLAGLTLAKLGFDDVSQRAIFSLCRQPHGMFLLTGPTGSGKTTTLYAAIAETHESRDKIITIEDPVEYQLPGVLQIPVNERKGLTFARGLRSILRHDPDKILVGEIRDSETAQIAVQSALTGHLVFTTVHANTVFDVVGRFDQFGIDSYTFSSAINGVLAQRLVRKLCNRCARPAGEGATRTADGVPGERFMRAVGCEHCRCTGYVGRFAIGELLTFSTELKTMIAQRQPQQAIQAAAAAQGWRSLRSQALVAAERGLTSLEEVNRVAP